MVAALPALGVSTVDCVVVIVGLCLTEFEDNLHRIVRHVTPADVTVTSHDVSVNSLLPCFTQSDCVTAAEKLLRGNY